MRPNPLPFVVGLVLTAVLTACGGAASTDVSGAGASAPAGATAAAAGSADDVAFAQLMIPHHQQAVEMAEMALDQAAAPEVVALAEQIKAAQDPEIVMMGGWLTDWGVSEDMPGDDHSGHDMGGMEMSGMMSTEDMDALAAAQGAEFDRLWLEMMIAHHEGAIEMADQVLQATQLPDVQSLAEQIKAAQEGEIAQMRALLNA